MAVVSVTRTIEASVEKVWASWDDFANIYKFNPNLKHSRLLDGSVPTGIDARRHCTFSDGKNYIRERIVGYQPHQLLEFEIYEGTLPFKSAIAAVEFRAINPTRTEITMRITFKPKLAVLGQIMLPLMKPQFRKMIGKLLDANGRFVTRHELATAA